MTGSGRAGRLRLTADRKGNMSLHTNRLLGVRVGAMFLCAYIWTLFGVGAMQDVVTVVPGAFHLLIPPLVRAIIWYVAAALAVVMAFLPERTWIGLVALGIPPMYTLVSYLYAWVSWLLGYPGTPRGWYLSAFYLAAVGLVLLAALIPDTPRHRDQSIIEMVKQHGTDGN